MHQPPSPSYPQQNRYALGVDLGREHDYTALVLVEAQEPAARDALVKGTPHLLVRHAERLPLGLPYPTIARHIQTCHSAATERLGASVACLIDRTGVGQAVSDLLGHIGLTHIAITLTGGNHVRSTAYGFTVPKPHLVRHLARLLGTRRLTVAPQAGDIHLLRHELTQFTAKIHDRTAHERFEARVEQDHDDLVIALALACWHLAKHTPTT